MFDKLKESIIDAVQEGQLKLGYRSETIRLYYPLPSLCLLTEKKADAAEMAAMLQEFSKENENELGKLEISHRAERFCIAVPPEGAKWVHEHTDPNGFLADFIHAIGHHGCTMEEILAQFRKHSDKVKVEALHNGEFDWLVEFEDGKPDAYCYCIADEGGHLTYHRFTHEDYEAFGF